ncbi:protein pigeon isoform X2 [Hetaerina americana]|uniref:protein pigeon isoform X2 n=1 Tax=Hetaerina americana TaxID=62018 RepID=UPI003A7F2764
MVTLHNIPATILENFEYLSELGRTKQWKLLGQEKNGVIIIGLQVESHDSEMSSVLIMYDHLNKNYRVLYSFDKYVNFIQASLNQSHTLLGFVTKEKILVNDDVEAEPTVETVYKSYLVEIKSGSSSTSSVIDLGFEKSHKMALQFLYWEKLPHIIEKERFLLLIHKEAIYLYQVNLKGAYSQDWSIDGSPVAESIHRVFVWSQWDAPNQCLFYIHHRKAVTSVEGEDEDSSSSYSTSFRKTGENEEAPLSPTLSCLQFHDDLPHETVLNIPLNLPSTPGGCNDATPCGIYEDDDPIPLRIHDCSLDLIVLSHPSGLICICHHYLYQPVKPPAFPAKLTKEGCDISSPTGNTSVHFAYSVTLLHHGTAVHCTIPGVPWPVARQAKATFVLYGEQHLLAFAPGVFTHMLDVGLSHEPYCGCHVVLSIPPTGLPTTPCHLLPLFFPPSCKMPLVKDPTQSEDKSHDMGNTSGLAATSAARFSIPASSSSSSLASLATASVPQVFVIDPTEMKLLSVEVTRDILVETFHSAKLAEIKMAIIHYFLVHLGDWDAISEYGNRRACLNEVTLWNACVTLLSPGQRLVPYRSDLWTRLWDNAQAGKRRASCDEITPLSSGILSPSHSGIVCDSGPQSGSRGSWRFRPSLVADKLMVSLVCYQPEALSRSSTPLSPGGAILSTSCGTADLSTLTASRKTSGVEGSLPFHEAECCTASKQEHVISVNLRELSMHLLKYSSSIAGPVKTGESGAGPPARLGMGRLAVGRQQQLHPMHVHAVATRHSASQLDASRCLCRLLCLAARVDSDREGEKGFSLVDQIDKNRRHVLFSLLERFRWAADGLAFPLPQGFSSFFTYLGYRTLPFPLFLQYASRSIFELQVDAMKAIIAEIDDSPQGMEQKLSLLHLLPRSRARRLMNAWHHPLSVMIRAREHALNILSGNPSAPASRHGRAHMVQQQMLQQRASRINASKTLQSSNNPIKGLAAFPSADRLSPLDTFLDLLTAKASLAELDFGLLVEATIMSTDDVY